MVTDQHTNGSDQSLGWMEIFNTVTTFILLNMLWLFGSLLIVTMPAVTAALFAAVAPWVRGQTVDKPFATFWTALRRYWLKATAVALIDLVVVGFVAANFLILRQMDLQQLMPILALIVTVLLTVVLVLGNVYFWPLLVTIEQPWRALLKNTFSLVFTHPLWGLLVAAAAAIPLTLTLFLPRAFLLTVTFAATALITQWGAWRVIRRYLNEDEIQKLGV